MSERAAEVDLQEIIEAIERIKVYTAALDFDRFMSRPEIGDAVALNLLVIGEAIRRLDPGFLNNEPSIPWSRIISLRNRIAHGYASLKLDIIWTVVSNELGDLDAAVRRLLAGI